ncbi:hypothetical protein L8S64_10910 [Enterobacter bugandensis]|nr:MULTISPECIES: hypothetical protein [Enterobacter]MCK6644076.1 hypothetical protein [Enterobacter bugandensis]MCK6964137.1 hypothetical protein [Enterobacter bugandensis]
MLLPVFVCDAKNFNSASPWAAYPRFASYVRSTLHDVWRQHPCPAEDPRPSRHKKDHALCSPGP